MNLAVKPRLCPSSGPLVLDGYGKLCLLTPAFSMEVKAPILPLHLHPVNLYLLRLTVEFIPFGEAFSGWNTSDAGDCPNILRQLCDGVGGELMYLHLKFQQDVGKHWVRGHPQTSSEELLKNHRLVRTGLWDSLLLRLAAHAFGKITVINHPTNSANCYGQRPKEEAPQAGTLVRDITNPVVRACVAQDSRLCPLLKTTTIETLATRISGTANISFGAPNASHHKYQETSEAFL
jgi:hypothetical protein